MSFKVLLSAGSPMFEMLPSSIMANNRNVGVMMWKLHWKQNTELSL